MLSISMVRGEAPIASIDCGRMPNELIVCGGTPRTVVSTAGRWREIKHMARRRFRVGVAVETKGNICWKDRARRDSIVR